MDEVVMGVMGGILEPFTIEWFFALAVFTTTSGILCYYSGGGACMGVDHVLLPIYFIILAITLFCCGSVGVLIAGLVGAILLFIGIIKSLDAHARSRKW